MDKFKLGIIGYGNMATAILNGIINAKIINNNQIAVADTDKSKLDSLADIGIQTTTDNQYIFDHSQYILLAVKPQMFDYLTNCEQYSTKAEAIISIMAGKKISTIKNKFQEKPSVIRIMPNTPCLVGEGMSGLVFDDTTNADLIEFVKKIFNSIGKTMIINESQIDNVSSISGSGPAYSYMFVNSMIKAGINIGLTFDEAKLLTIQTITGANKMLENATTTEEIDILIDRVCSKGGSTIEAVKHFNENNLEQIIIDGIQKCKNRNIELSKI